MFARMPSTPIVALLLCSMSWGCRPLFRQAPWSLAALEEPAAEEDLPDEDAGDGDTSAAAAEAENVSDEQPAMAAPPVALTQADWILRVAPLGETLAAKASRWRHVALEEMLAQPVAEQSDFSQWLKHESPAVAGNAAIVAARQRLFSPPANARGTEAEIVSTLVATVRAAELKLPQRRAALEALGSLTSEAARQGVYALDDQYGDFAGENRNVYSADLHLELLAVLGQQPDEAALTRLMAALDSRAADVRLAAVRAWPQSAAAALPEGLVALAQDPDPRVRGECLQLLAKCEHPQAFKLAQRAINDLKFEVRLASVEALSAIAGDAAREELERLSKHPTESLRAAAVKALAARRAWEPALVAAGDEAWQVRLALASQLAGLSTPAAERAAEKLLDDRSTDVQQKTVEAVAEWPWPRGGKLLLAALDSRIFLTRETAAKKLGAQWAPAANFPYLAEPNARVEALVALQEQWTAEFPADVLAARESEAGSVAMEASPFKRPLSAAVRQQVAADVRVLNAADSGAATKAAACERLAAVAADLPAALAALMKEQKTTLPPELYAQVLPALDANFKLLAQLETAEVTLRRQAASGLRQSAEQTPLSELALLRLVELVVTEGDAVIWHEIQQLLAEDMREPVVRLQYAALNHPVAEVQRRACLYLGNHRESRHAVVLAAALEDENPLVVRAAAEAYGQLESLDSTLPLVRLLASRDRELVLAVSVALAKQGEESGGDGLERLALDIDPKLRRTAIETMAELKQPRFVPALIKGLDDQLGIKQTALNGLAATIGQDIGRGTDETPPPMAEQIHRWKQWHAKLEVARAKGR